MKMADSASNDLWRSSSNAVREPEKSPILMRAMDIAAEMKARKEAETEGSKGRCLLSVSDLSLSVCHASILLLSSPHFIHYSQLCTD